MRDNMIKKIKNLIYKYDFVYLRFFIIQVLFLFGLFLFPPLAGNVFDISPSYYHFKSLGGQYVWSIGSMLLAMIHLFGFITKKKTIEILSMFFITTTFLIVAIIFAFGSWSTAIPIYSSIAIASLLVNNRLIHEN